MRLPLLLGLASMLIALATSAPATASPQAVRDCNVWAYYPNTKITSVRNMTCRAARDEMRRYRGQIHRRFRTPSRFSCYRVSGGPLGGQWRCVKGSRAFRFDFGD